MSIKQLIEESIKAKLSEDMPASRDAEYDKAKKRVQKMKKGDPVSFTNTKGVKTTGRYKGLENRGGRSYAKVEVDNKGGMTMVPVTQID